MALGAVRHRQRARQRPEDAAGGGQNHREPRPGPLSPSRPKALQLARAPVLVHGVLHVAHRHTQLRARGVPQKKAKGVDVEMKEDKDLITYV